MRLLRQLGTESFSLAVLGGAAGLAVAWAGVRALVALSPDDLPRMDTIGIDGRIIAFSAGITVLTALLFGLAPAIQLAGADVAPALHGGRGAPGGAQHRLRRGLVVAEVALAFVLVVTGGLLLRFSVPCCDSTPDSVPITC
jgi:hypothetical protein